MCFQITHPCLLYEYQPLLSYVINQYIVSVKKNPFSYLLLTYQATAIAITSGKTKKEGNQSLRLLKCES